MGFWSLLPVFPLVVMSTAKIPDKQTQDTKETFFLFLIFISARFCCAEGQEMSLECECILSAVFSSKAGKTKLSTRNGFLPSSPWPVLPGAPDTSRIYSRITFQRVEWGIVENIHGVERNSLQFWNTATAGQGCGLFNSPLSRHSSAPPGLGREKHPSPETCCLGCARLRSSSNKEFCFFTSSEC